MEEGRNVIGVSATVNLSNEQFKAIFGMDSEKFNPGESKGLVIIAQAEYIKKKEKWVLKGKPKIYQGLDLVLMQKSLRSARDKARDFSIKGDLSGIRAAAELWAMDHNDSYDGFCIGADAQQAIVDIARNEKTALCDDTATTWAAFSPLYDTTAQCYCVDYRGTGKALNSPCPKAAVTVCP